jgi:hypothetical protein
MDVHLQDDIDGICRRHGLDELALSRNADPEMTQREVT